MRQCLVTTIDNPHNPFEDPKGWDNFDKLHGYQTQSLLAYFSHNSLKLEEQQYHEEVENAINDLLEFNPFGLYIKIYEDEAELLIKLANEAYYSLNSKPTNN